MTNTEESVNRLVAAVAELQKREGIQIKDGTLINNCLDLKSFLHDSEGILSPELITNITNVATK
ncbi:hypothetical protein ABEI56_05480 [Peribacillus castrilensis]|uniref:hypothetical protein n=1 Tax=Peribacillus castrilensis TaxID=2897690 RepID=UPI003D2A175B